MKISTASWHYRFIMNARYKAPETVCSYVTFFSLLCLFWASVTVIGILFIVGMFHLVLAMFLGPFFVMDASIVKYIPVWLSSKYGQTDLMYMGITLDLALAAYLAYLGFLYIGRRIKKERDASSPSLVVARLKDFKNKTCTLIDYTS